MPNDRPLLALRCGKDTGAGAGQLLLRLQAKFGLLSLGMSFVLCRADRVKHKGMGKIPPPERPFPYHAGEPVVAVHEIVHPPLPLQVVLALLEGPRKQRVQVAIRGRPATTSCEVDQMHAVSQIRGPLVFFTLSTGEDVDHVAAPSQLRPHLPNVETDAAVVWGPPISLIGQDWMLKTAILILALCKCSSLPVFGPAGGRIGQDISTWQGNSVLNSPPRCRL